MSKIIKMTPDYIEQCKIEFEKALLGVKLSDGKLTFSKTFTKKEEKAYLWFTAQAWAKMVVVIQEFSKEVAWHGLARRLDGEDNGYIVYDIMVYPQEVTASTVNTNQEKYNKWLMSFDDDKFSNIRMQGHSHVNMGTSPSSVDLNHQEQILSQLEDDMFYIFMIWNKSFSHTIKIYDLAKNTLFEDSDISVGIAGDGESLTEFLDNAKKMVEEKTYTYTPVTTTKFNGYTQGSLCEYNTITPPKSGKTSGGKKKNDGVKKNEKKFDYGYCDDDDDYGPFGFYRGY